MAKQTQDLSIHTKKFYRVTLLSVDPAKESHESFAIKMSIRLRIPMPKVKHLIKCLPCDLKSGLTIQQANKLYHVLQELGGIAEVEHYYVTPGSVTHRGKKKGDVNSTDGKRRNSMKQGIICPSCGWEEPVEAEYCSICLKKFKEKLEIFDKAPPADDAAKKTSTKNASPITNSGIPVLSELLNNKVILAAGITIIALLVLLILK